MRKKIKNPGPFQQELMNDLLDFLEAQKNRFPESDTLTIDLHCHDHNSNVPDELLGRILNVPETWLKTEDLLRTLRGNGCEVITITNHNNARSCFELQDHGLDVLTGAEFSCTVPDFDVGIHVLTYGFSRDQEKELNKLRKNVYSFLRFTKENELPVIWAHPLYFYSRNGVPPMEFFNKMALVFERFEVLNGQRDTWQNLLVRTWIEGLSPQTIDEHAGLLKVDIDQYCSNRYKKSFSGGSDSHMGIFSGLTGTRLYIPDLAKRKKTEKISELALEAIKKGDMAPYGTHQNSEKLTVAFLDYVFQIALHKKDPGLLRILLHKGTTRDKLIALAVTNGFAELQRHRVTMNFIELFHHCFMGQKPSISRRWFVPKIYKPVFDDALKIAKTRQSGADNLVEVFHQSISSMSLKLNNILHQRLKQKIEEFRFEGKLQGFNLGNLIEKFELPSELRVYMEAGGKRSGNQNTGIHAPDIPRFLDGLSFPFLSSALILAANFVSARVLYNNRRLLQSFSQKFNKYKHPQKMLWLTDTFDDNNGVSMVLKSMLEEIKRRDLPIDILVCSSSIRAEDHLLVVKPLAEYTLPLYHDQPLRIPDFLEIQHLFHDGEYDRLICSTEGPMGLASLYLKHAYSVNAYFYIHTDWIMFAKKVLDMDPDNTSRFRRLLRAFYRNFDGLFVLNTDQHKWLTGKHMGFQTEKVFLTSHWADEQFYRRRTTKTEAFDLDLQSRVLLFAGRISLEKGVMEIPEIVKKVKLTIPDLQIIFAGAGPAEEKLKALLPEAVYLGWVSHEELPSIYSAADLLILPSKFDTFSCVVLEAISCGLPVVAYKTKGPKDIIEHQKNGFLVDHKDEMIQSIIAFFKDEKMQKDFRIAAVKRSKIFAKNGIIEQFLMNTGLKN